MYEKKNNLTGKFIRQLHCFLSKGNIFSITQVVTKTQHAYVPKAMMRCCRSKPKMFSIFHYLST